MNIFYFAYEIDTHDSATIAKILQGKGVGPGEVTEEQYFDLEVNILRDLIRFQVMPRFEKMSPEHQSQTLPVFVAPEFFFKYENGKPYSRETIYNRIEGYLKPISQAFPKVLIVAGTIWWGEPAATPDQLTIHNTLPVLYGGKLIHTWQKTRLSQIDGLQHGPEVWDRWEADHQRILDETQTPFFSLVAAGSTFGFGLEVCLDHDTLKDKTTGQITYGVLRTEYLKAHPNENEGAGVDVHVLVAAGMRPQPENIVARSGGLYLRCDGGAGAVRSNCYDIKRDGVSPAEALRGWNPKYSDVMPEPAPGAQGSEMDENDRMFIYGPVVLG